MRRAATAAFALLLAALLTVSVFALPRLDGVDNGTEWRGAKQIRLVNGQSNSGVNFGLVKYLTDLETQRIFLCFMYTDPAITQDSAVAGVIVFLEDASPVTFTVTQPAETPDAYLYSMEGAIAINEQHGVICELCIGVKDGLPAEVPMSVRFFDAEGIPSNRYAFTVETGAAQKTPSPAASYDEPEDTTARSKAAEATTTEDYFKHGGGAVYTYNYNYTAAKRTTAAPTAEESSADQTAAAKPTKEKTAAAKTTRAPKPTTGKTDAPAREIVIISEVYVSAESTAGVSPERVQLYAKGGAYQTAAIAIAAVILAALAAYAVTAGKHRNRTAPPAESEQTEQHPD